MKSVKRLCFGTALSSIVIFGLMIVARDVGGPVLSKKMLVAISGATKEEVLRRLGNPSDIVDDDVWVYSRLGNPGWVEVNFHNGIVDHINDESSFPGWP